MIPFIEPRVKIASLSQLQNYQKIAKKLGYAGMVVLNQESKSFDESLQNDNYHLTRGEYQGKNIPALRTFLAKKRNDYHLISVKTSNEKVAQWAVKDNRVDIISIPFPAMKQIVTPSFANVAATNHTFIEISLKSLLTEQFHLSYFLRVISSIFHLLFQQKACLLLSLNIKNQYDFRDPRTFKAIADQLGYSWSNLKLSQKLFLERLSINKAKLSENFIAPGIWKKDKEKELALLKNFKIPDNITPELPFNLQAISSSDKKLERQRYLSFEIISEQKLNITKKELQNIIWEQLQKLYGSIGCSQVGLYLLAYDTETSYGILRCSHHAVRALRISLATIASINQMRVIVHINKVSGTINKLNS
ncbi:MAG: Rpp14/Pop5 family protein [Asgard group archaeon]|nr:Rpp14/Pop5 family protein [Asgard group archaeon]